MHKQLQMRPNVSPDSPPPSRLFSSPPYFVTHNLVLLPTMCPVTAIYIIISHHMTLE